MRAAFPIIALIALSARAAGSSGSSTAPPTSQLSGDRFADVVNVRDFGAKGDAATDDTAAIQAAALSGASSGARLYLPRGTYRIASSVSIPGATTIELPRGARILIGSGATLTIDGHIEAGYYPVFQFADASASVAASNPGSWDSGSARLYPRSIKVDWFGAVPDAVPPSHRGAHPNGVPSGTDSSDAFRRAVRFAQEASLKGGGSFIYTPYVTLSFAPNGAYRVRGDNVLGVQRPRLGAARIVFDGQGAALLHEVLKDSDALIRNAGYLYRPLFRDFSVDPFNANGKRRQGDFLTTDSPAGFVPFVQPRFTNLRVAMGYTNRGYDRIFVIDGTTMADNGVVRDSQFGSFRVFWHCTNPEAVNWLFEKNSIIPSTDHSVMFDIETDFSGSLTAQNNEMVLSHAAPLILKTGAGKNAAAHAKFAFLNNRCEERQESDTAHFDVSFGIVDLDGTNFLAGAAATRGSTRSPHKRVALIRGNALVRLRNCAFQTNQVTLQTNSPGQTGRRDGLYVDNCLFQNESKPGFAAGLGLKYTILDSAGAASSVRSALHSSGWKNVELGSFLGMTGHFEFPHKLVRGQGIPHTVRLSVLRSSDGKPTANALFELPSFLVITSVKLYSTSFKVSEIDRITFSMSDASGAVLSPNTVMLDGSAVRGLELLPAGKNITTTDVDYALGQALFGLGSRHVQSADVMPQSYLEITYEGISKPYQLPSTVTASYHVHDAIQ